jgi:NitT/TauT family transport system substrate-binding protein
VRRTAARVAVVLAAFLALAGSRVVAQPELTDFTYASIGLSASEWPVYIADDQGFFKDEGLKFSEVNVGTPPQVINALATGATQIGNDGTESDIAAVVHGLPIRIVGAQFVPMPYQLIVSPSITSFEALKGKAVILGTKRDVTAVALYHMLAAHHMKPEDVDILVAGSSAARYAALASGNVQGAMLSQPFDILAQQKGMKSLGSAYDLFKDKWVFASLIVNKNYADANRGLIVKFLRAMRKADQWGYSHRDASIAILISRVHVDPAIADASYDLLFTKWKAFDPSLAPKPAGLLAVAQFMKDQGDLTDIPPVSAFYDPSFLAELNRR